MKAVVVDTNVGVVANGGTPHAAPDCVLACVDELDKARSAVIVIDDAGRVLKEYRRHLSPAGQPGAGDFFMKWVWTNQANPGRCELVHITPRSDDPNDFEEFPDDPALAGFDRSDRKFVAVARASGQEPKPKVLNASDTDWWLYREPLARHGITVEFVCPELMKG